MGRLLPIEDVNIYIWCSINLKTNTHMKKLLLTGLTLCVVAFANAQNRPAASTTILERLQRQGNQKTVPYQEAISGSEMPSNKINATVANQGSSHKSASVQTLVGNSTYDLQTNGSMQKTNFITASSGKSGLSGGPNARRF